MTLFKRESLILIAALAPIMQVANAQLNCANPANIGSGDQTSGGVVGNNELANACGTVGAGFYSLENDIASLNSAFGTNAMFSTTSGGSNSSFGAASMYSNTTGANNTAFGYQALFTNTTGKGNAAQGVNALFSNTEGVRNLGIGSNALYANTTGNYNIALGFDAGYNVTTGSNNIEIGNSGTASDDATIQLGVQGTQIKTTIAGIYGTQVTGSAVYVTAAGQLGVQGSSERFKTDIATMPEISTKLDHLRPVTFRYRTDPKSVRQYGLIAEEVVQVYPELVIRDDSGKIMGVHYEELAPMLLRQTQEQQHQLTAQDRKLAAQDAHLRELEQRFADLAEANRATQVALQELRSRDSQIAMRR